MAGMNVKINITGVESNRDVEAGREREAVQCRWSLS